MRAFPLIEHTAMYIFSGKYIGLLRSLSAAHFFFREEIALVANGLR